jgi:hypothetical protein
MSSATRRIQCVRVSVCPVYGTTFMLLSFVLLGCRKGNRECTYPEPQSSQKTGRSGSKSGKSSSVEGSSPEDHDDDGTERLPPIMDDEEHGIDTEKTQYTRETSETPALTLDQSPSPATETSLTTPVAATRPQFPRKGSQSGSKFITTVKAVPALPKDIQFYLNYFKTHITHHHYALKRDTSNFLKTDFLAQAMKYEPLLYAVVGYAAYFHTLAQPDGRISTFLQYYNESVTRLRISITKQKKQGLATFLTILQLAAIEVKGRNQQAIYLLTECLGSTRRLGQPHGPSKSRLRYVDATIHS